jgi:hypothetical protein
MRHATFGLILAATILAIGGGLSDAAHAQATQTPSLSPKTINALEQMIQGLSPDTINMLVAEAAKIQHGAAGGMPGSLDRQELKQHKAELEDLRTQVCSTIIAC